MKIPPGYVRVTKENVHLFNPVSDKRNGWSFILGAKWSLSGERPFEYTDPKNSGAFWKEGEMRDDILIVPQKIRAPLNYRGLVEDCRRFQEQMTPEERLQFWAAIQEGYCRFCGRELEFSGMCHCENDE